MLRRIIVVLAVVATVPVGATAAFAATPDVNEQDRTFLVNTHQGNLAEIQTGQVAEKQGTAEAVRQAGTMLVDDHTKLDEEVRRVAREVNVSLPDSPSDKQQAELQRISAKSGAEFDKAWVSAEITEHREDLNAGAEEQANGASDQVKNLAAGAKPVIQSHLDVLEKIQNG